MDDESARTRPTAPPPLGSRSTAVLAVLLTATVLGTLCHFLVGAGAPLRPAPGATSSQVAEPVSTDVPEGHHR